MPSISFHSFPFTFLQRRPRDEHQHRPITPAGDSLPQDKIKFLQTDGHDRSAQQFTNVPPPIPDNGPLSFSNTRTTPYSSFLSAPSSSLIVLHSSTSPPATLTVTSGPIQLQSSESMPSTIDPTSSSGPISLQHQVSDMPKIPITAIVSAAVGIGLLIIAGFIFLRVCKRPRPRELPKPSLPILDSPFVEENVYKSNESPLFGGEERFSTNNGNSSGLWDWTQYPQVKPTEVPKVRLFPPSTPVSLEPERRLSSPLAIADLSRELPIPRPPPSQSVPTLGPSLLSVNSTHQPKTANSVTSLHRLSTRSLSLYPNSPECTQVGRGNTRVGSSENVEKSSPDIAYDGADIASPRFLARDLNEESLPSPKPSGSRSRIKSSYFSYTPGSYPRMSSVQSGLETSRKLDDDFDSNKLPPIQKSDSHRTREKALAAALGVTSPSTIHTSLSPPSTLYPDDSLSVVDAKRASRRLHRKPTPNMRAKRRSYLETRAPGMISTSSTDSGTALGSLMLMEFGATSKSSGVLPDNNSISSKGKHIGPPRVPSPPALPSLAQMGLEHANPEGFGEYRSATYSICGLYEGDRKSRSA
ncbi:hypothetical protein L218DRAFT_957045 [Marasmius fiardii PR-910]|nr:hypothetical protein L218DRAFT_957045 [Marasmius fiardii PR-910]